MIRIPIRFRNRLGRLGRDVFALLHFRSSRAELQALMPREFSSTVLWQVTQRYQGKGWFRDLMPWQVESEYCSMVDWVALKKPRIVMEIGTAKGATLLAWSRIASQMVISVDLPGGIHGGGYPPAKERLYREFVADRPGVQMVICRGDSHSEETRDHIKGALDGRTVDFLFIDGDHTYAGVTRDFELWSCLVTPGGHVGFHDIVPHRELPDCEVDRLWGQLKQQYKTVEFVADPRQGWAGIGIVQLNVRAER